MRGHSRNREFHNKFTEVCWVQTLHKNRYRTFTWKKPSPMDWGRSDAPRNLLLGHVLKAKIWLLSCLWQGAGVKYHATCPSSEATTLPIRNADSQAPPKIYWLWFCIWTRSQVIPVHIEVGKHCSKYFPVEKRRLRRIGCLSSCGKLEKQGWDTGSSAKNFDSLPRWSTSWTRSPSLFFFFFFFFNIRVKKKHPRFTYPLIDVLDINRLKTDDTNEWYSWINSQPDFSMLLFKKICVPWSR